MLILSNPLLDRELVSDDDVFDAPIAWRDRQTLYYAANGAIRRRDFDSWVAKDVPFRAVLGRDDSRARHDSERRLPLFEVPARRWVLRVAQAFDGFAPRAAVDIVIDGGRIERIEPQAGRDDLPVIDLGDVTAVPGFIDAYARLPVPLREEHGPLMLSLGVTTVVARHPDAQRLNTVWSGERMPGPRVLAY
ncbi:MAG: hypothetical protein AAF560_30840, partial [Acidobacteriota bacterium]